MGFIEWKGLAEMRFIRLSMFMLCLASPAIHVAAQEAPPAVVVTLPQDGSETHIQGSLTGYETRSYVFDNIPGSTTTVVLGYAGRASLYHNIISPSGEAIFDGSVLGRRSQSVLTENGRYRVQVYLMRNDARRGKHVKYKLTLSRAAGGAGGAHVGCAKASGQDCPGQATARIGQPE